MESENRKNIGECVDRWITEDELPSKACLQVAKKKYDPYPNMDEDEIQAYKDFRRWFVNKEFDLLQMIPQQEKDDFYIPFEDDDAIPFAFRFNGLQENSTSVQQILLQA